MQRDWLTNSRGNNLFHVILIQQGAICNFKFGLNMGFIENKLQKHHVPYKYSQNIVFTVV